MRLRLVLFAAPCVTAMEDAGLNDLHSRKRLFTQRGERWLTGVEGEQQLVRH